MIGPLATTVIVSSLLVAAGCVLLAVLDRRVGRALLGALAVLEAALLVQSVLGVVLLARTDREVAAAPFLAYLVVILLVLPGGAVWGVAERSRWGPGVLAVACLVVPVLVLRLQQVWGPAGA